MFIRSMIYAPMPMKDIRIPELRKVLKGFPKESLVKVQDNHVEILYDDSVLYTLELKINTPSLPDISFIIETLDSVEGEESFLEEITVDDYITGITEQLKLSLSSGELLAEDQNLRNSERFEELMNMKSSEGMKFFLLPGFELNKTYKIPIFKGFINLNKNDAIGVKVFRNAIDANYPIVDMNIYKDKIKRPMHMIFKILDI